MSRVFVVQRPSRLERGRWVEKLDLAPAEQYGELVTMLPPGNLDRDPLALLQARRSIEAALEGFCPGRDFLLPLGDPVACAILFQVVGQARTMLGPIRVLKFDKRKGRYDSYTLPVR